MKNLEISESENRGKNLYLLGSLASGSSAVLFSFAVLTTTPIAPASILLAGIGFALRKAGDLTIEDEKISPTKTTEIPSVVIPSKTTEIISVVIPSLEIIDQKPLSTKTENNVVSKAETVFSVSAPLV
jgi:hypothetical protein